MKYRMQITAEVDHAENVWDALALFAGHIARTVAARKLTLDRENPVIRTTSKWVIDEEPDEQALIQGGSQVTTERDKEAADLILAHFQAAEMKQITWTEAGERVQWTVAQARAEGAREERAAILRRCNEYDSTNCAGHDDNPCCHRRTAAAIAAWIEKRGEAE
jgi:hypothetical protein